MGKSRDFRYQRVDFDDDEDEEALLERELGPSQNKKSRFVEHSNFKMIVYGVISSQKRSKLDKKG